ncbi:hypothetical protein N1851_029946 [Merluccius polli]|uniref:Uncharacterized protein n=1 Tax=Merluccius polli TaxID=89951 RepID=A0AA47NQF9_MERPO|nr:hypothetical protein N1851_029946 [Merluccius polli]
MYQLGVTCWVTVASPGKTTPYLNPQPGAQLKYNIMLEHTKIHEMLWREELGEMKRRFHVLHRTFPPGTFIIKNGNRMAATYTDRPTNYAAVKALFLYRRLSVLLGY